MRIFIPVLAPLLAFAAPAQALYTLESDVADCLGFLAAADVALVFSDSADPGMTPSDIALWRQIRARVTAELAAQNDPDKPPMTDAQFATAIAASFEGALPFALADVGGYANDPDVSPSDFMTGMGTNCWRIEEDFRAAPAP